MEIGNFVQQPGDFKAFIPHTFPLTKTVDLPSSTEQLHAQANLALGKLDGITQTLPDIDFFIFMYVKKEAALSSEIEGTQATMIDAIKAEAKMPEGLPKDVSRILKYIDAMNKGLKILESMPLSLRLIKQVHKILLEKTPDAPGRTPGEFRTSQNWVGGAFPKNARFVPPPVYDMKRALGDFEKFLHADIEIPPLIKTALVHTQFETIHPFLDGNGRTGRLLITFYLCQQNILERPVLYLSEYFKKHRELYFDLLHNYHTKGEVLPWFDFFLEGVREVSNEAIDISRKINKLRESDIIRIQSLGKGTKSAMLVFNKLYEVPIIDVRLVEEWTNLSRQAANNLVDKLLQIGILTQRQPEKTYGRTFVYKNYLNLFAN